MKALLRLMVWTLVAVVVTTAAFQVAGRLILSDLDSFEPEINRILADADINISGLEGSWHHLNPVVKLETIDLPGYNNSGSGIRLELDVLESLIRNRLVMRTMTVERLTLALTRHTDGSWRLLGQEHRGNIHFDVQSFLRHSDELQLTQGLLRLVAPDTSPEEVEHLDGVRLEVKLRNRGDRHQGQISLSTLKTDCRGCGIELSYDLIDWKPLIGPRKVSGKVVADASKFAVSREIGQLWNVSGLLSSLHSQWEIDTSVARGWLKMGAKDIQFQTGTLPSVATEAELRVNLNGGVLESTINAVSFSGAKNTGMLEHVSLTANDQGEFWLAFPEIDVQPAIDVLESIFQYNPKVHQWLVGLNPRGHLAEGLLYVGLSPALSMNYVVHIQDAELDAFKGSPRARNIAGIAVGNESSLSLTLASQDFEIEFPVLFKQPSLAQQADAVIDFYFRPDYFGLRGHHMGVSLDQTLAQGGFSLATPKMFSGRQLTMSLSVKDMGMNEAKEYIPQKLSDNLRNWLGQNLIDGQIPLATLIYHGYVKPENNPSPIQLEIQGSIVDGELRFHDDWPIAKGLNGDFLAGTRWIKAKLHHAETLGNEFQALAVELPADLTRVRIAADLQTTGERALNYVRQSPLIEWLPSLKPEWQITGPVKLKLSGLVPLKDESLPLQLSMDADLQGDDLNLEDIGLKIENLEGTVEYQHPYRVVSNQLSSMIFSEPVKISIASADDAVDVQMDGSTNVTRVLDWLDIEDTGLVDGPFAYSGKLTIFTLEDRLPMLILDSDLKGVEIDLPGELAKSAEQPSHMEISYEMMPTVDELKFSEGDALRGWLHFREGSLVRGAIGVNQSPALVDTASQEIVITGQLADVKAESGGKVDDPYLSFKWALIDFQIGHLGLHSGSYDNLLLNGEGDEQHSSLAVNADDISGKIDFRLGEIPSVDIAFLRFPESESELEDPMAEIDLGFMQPADVSISDIRVGSESYGSWVFGLRELASGWQFQQLTADIKGIHIESKEGVSWLNPQAGGEESRFSGTVLATDLAKVLPQWGYAPSVESESMQFVADLHWPGSPLAIAMANISGEAKFNVKEGRFLDVDSANNTLRIFSLFNFTAIAKRMSLDFSDVFGKGISFDKIKADVAFDHGLMTFQTPMLVEGTGSRFKVNGSVNMVTGRLDNDLIVTLPVNRSLPWYAGYLSIANPLAGVGVLVGERIFRNQLEQFSSAKYSVSGTLDDPKVELVSIFTKEMNTDSRQPLEPETESESSASDGENLGKVQPESDHTNKKERKRG